MFYISLLKSYKLMFIIYAKLLENLKTISVFFSAHLMDKDVLIYSLPNFCRFFFN